MDLIKEYEKARGFLSKAMLECLRDYPKHQKTVIALWKHYIYLLYENTERRKGDYMKFIHYLYEFSDFIAKKYYPDEFDEDWRRPILLEDLINCAMWERMEIQLREDPKFKNDLIEDLQTNPLTKDNPLANLIEGLIAGGGCVSTMELAETMDISPDSMLNQTKKLIKKKVLLPERDFLQLRLDDFKEKDIEEKNK